MKITLPDVFTVKQEHLIFKYLNRGRQSLETTEWKEILAGFDALHEAVIEIDSTERTFRQVYAKHVDARFADRYISRLLTLDNVARDYTPLWAETAQMIVTHLRQKQLYWPDIPETNLLLAYCLYFWESFSKGYAFEVEIYRDLTKSGVIFQAHDIRDRRARLSARDLIVLNLRGDIKTSSYFLHVGRSRSLPHDFYITRFYENNRQRTLVVMLQLTAWEEIDGETIVGLLREATGYFPAPVRVTLAQGTVVITAYDVWKAKVLSRQQDIQE